MNTAVIIVAIVAATAVAIVALSLYHVRKTRCKHSWYIVREEIKEFYRERPGLNYRSRYNVKVYTLRCMHCGDIRIVTDAELTERVSKSLQQS